MQYSLIHSFSNFLSTSTIWPSATEVTVLPPPGHFLSGTLWKSRLATASRNRIADAVQLNQGYTIWDNSMVINIIENIIATDTSNMESLSIFISESSKQVE